MQCDVSLNVIQEEWGWAFDGTVDRVVDVSLFGNVLVKSDENIYHIIPEDLTVCCLCAVTDAGSVLNDPSFVHDWEMLHWVKLAQDAHGQLPNGKVIAFKLPRTLGGKDEPSNMYYADVNDYIGGMGQIARQIKDLPEGAEIRIKVE